MAVKSDSCARRRALVVAFASLTASFSCATFVQAQSSDEVTAAALFLCGAGSEGINGQSITIAGGEV
mgnify:CR=1 FL=1